METAQNADGNRLRFTVNTEKGHVVSWSLHDRATRLMLAHSRGRSEIDGRRVKFDPNVERTARIMGKFFGDSAVEEALMKLIDADFLPEPAPVARATAYRPSVDEMAAGTASADVTPEWLKAFPSADELAAMGGDDPDVEPGAAGPLEGDTRP